MSALREGGPVPCGRPLTSYARRLPPGTITQTCLSDHYHFPDH